MANLLVVDVDGDPLAQHQLHAGRVAQLHRGFDDQVNSLVGGRDPVEVHRVVDGRVPGASRRHLEGWREVTGGSQLKSLHIGKEVRSHQNANFPVYKSNVRLYNKKVKKYVLCS